MTISNTDHTISDHATTSYPSGMKGPHLGQGSSSLAGIPVVATATRQAAPRQVSTRQAPVEQVPAALQLESSEGGPEELISRMLSETAHDLRAPLTTIREAVRLVRDGDLGRVSSPQRECLSAAINQCDCVDQMVDEMLHSRQMDSGYSCASRSWVPVQEIRESVEQTLHPFMMPRNVHLIWDGPFDRSNRVFADAVLLRRLIVNLVGNAIRVTRDGQSVLIRATVSPNRQSLLWSIVDQGKGISPADMESIAAGRAPSRSVSGLGLLISRQLASAHFSPLRIESRVGTGTAVSFRTPMGGPAAVVKQWAHWRKQLFSPQEAVLLQRPAHVHNTLPRSPTNSSSNNGSKQPIGEVAPPRRVRIDNPSQAIELRGRKIQPLFPDQMILSSVSLGAAIPSDVPDQFNQLVQRSIDVSELVYRTGRLSWMIAMDADFEVAMEKRRLLETTATQQIEGLRLSWGAMSLVLMAERDVDAAHCYLAKRVSDLVVRESLKAAKRTVGDANQVRLGTSPIAVSQRASQRLDRQVRRLRGASAEELLAMERRHREEANRINPPSTAEQVAPNADRPLD